MPVSNWSDKNARNQDGVTLSAEEILRGVLNDTQDALRVSGGGGGGGGGGSTTPSSPQSVRLSNGSAWVDTIPVNQSGVVSAGALTGNGQSVTLDLIGATGVAFDLRGTFTATVTFEGSVNGTDFFTLAVLPAGGSANVATVTTATAAGAWMGSASGMVQVRARTSAYTSGTVNVTVRAMQAASVVHAMPTGQTTVAVSGTVNPSGGSLAAGTNAIGDVGLQVRANATGAATIHHFVSAASTNTANIKSSAGRVLGWDLANTTASWRYVKLHNTAGTPTAGAAVVATIAIPPNGVNVQSIGQGLAFATGIARSAVTGAADADATATAANDIVGDIYFA